MINVAKLSISFSAKTSQDVRLRVKQHLRIDKEGGVGKYLRLPEHFGRSKQDLFSSTVDRMVQRALSCPSRFISMAGKAVMLQGVLSTMPTFAMSCFELPVSVCKRIQSVLPRFWWDSKEGEKNICWISWDKLTLPKSSGGLDFRDIQAFNQALLAKIAWRLLTKPECLLSRILGGKYCNNSHFLKVEAAISYSHGWKGILLDRDLLVQHLGRVIGDGETTCVWKDSWINPEKNLRPQGPVFLQDQDLLVSDLLSRETKEWNLARVKNLLPELADHILTLRPSKLGAPDSHVWSFHSSRAYSAKSGYLALQATKFQSTSLLLDNEPDEWSWNKHIWSPKLLPKIKMFMWKIAQNALPTIENLQKRGMQITTSCCRCGEPETTLHLLFQCNFAKEVWALGPWSVTFIPSYRVSFKSALIASRSWSNLSPYGFTRNAFPWICWFIWTSRNQLLFEKKPSTA